MKKKPILLFGYLAFAITTAVGQENIRLSGKVVDRSTKEPLAFSTVSILGTSEGVVSNFQGLFEFSIPATRSADTLYVSMLGYQPYKAVFSSHVDTEEITIQLEESIVVLEEVAVSEKRLSALEIVTKSVERITENYPVTPYLLEGFTRSHKYECGRYVKLYEADFEVYGGGYHKKTPERIYINESRQSADVPYFYSRVLRANNNPFHAMGHLNDVLFRSYSFSLKQNEYAIDKFITNDDGDLVYVIKTNHSKYITHTMYIHADSYALLKVVMEMNTPDGEDWNPLLNKGISSDSLNFKVRQLIKTIQFEKRGDRYYSKYTDWLIAGTTSYQESDEPFCDWGFRFETMFDNVITENPIKPDKAKLYSFRSQKEPKSETYDPTFWKDYTLTQDFPVTAQIIMDLEARSGPIEEQFKKAATRK